MRQGMLSDMYYEELVDRWRNDDYGGCEHFYEFLKNYFLPVRYRGKIINDYWIDARGVIFSTKRYYPHKISYSFHSGNCGYPKMSVPTVDQFGFRRYKTTTVHRLVCESFHEKPIPEGVSKKEWENTPDSVKRCFNDYWEVNHKDHNTHNYHPDNLEWVSRQQNVDKYQESLKEAA